MNCLTPPIVKPHEETWALVPLKHLAKAKARLAPALSETDRRELVLSMASDVLAALKEVDAITQILLVTNEPEAGRLLGGRKLDVFYSAEHETLNEELAHAAAYAYAQGAERVLIVHADLPFLNRQAIEHFLDAGSQIHMRAAQCKLGTGTNLLLLPLPLDIPLVFGDRSLAGFVQLARARGQELEVINNSALGMDIDGPEDFDRLLAAGQAATIPGPATQALVQRLADQHATPRL